MAVFRRWFLIGFALVLGGGQLFAAGAREERVFNAALAAFNDQFYDRAEAGFAQFLQAYRKSTNAPAAVLRLAQSEFYLGKYAAAISRLADPANLAKARTAGLADQYIYWRAEAQFASGDFSDAAHTFISLTDKFPDSPLALNAVVEAAAAFGQSTNWARVDDLLDNTNGLFQRAAQLDPASGVVANGRLLQSESKCSQTNFAAAIRILKLLNPATLTPAQDWKRAHQLYRANLQLDDLDAALAATTNLLQIARAGQGAGWATNLAESVACRADALEKLGRLAEASAAWQEDFSNNVPVGLQQRAVLKVSELAAAQNNLTNAEAGLEKFLAQFTNAPAAEIALLTLGEMYLQDAIALPAATSALAAAQAKFDQLLAASTNGPLAAKAFLNRGWCHWLAKQYPESLADFQSAVRLLPVSEDLAVARFKMGDAEFAQTNYPAALTDYQAVLADVSTLPPAADALAARALYQILRARLALHDTGGVDDAMRELLGKFFTSAPADSSLLLAGQGFSDFGLPAKARELFRGFEIERADSPLLPQVAFALARTFEREHNWPAAITNYQNWLKTYPTNELRPQVEYARDWAVAQAGDEAGAFALFTNFLSQFTNNAALTPLARWWVADHFFRLGDTNLVQAEQNYELIFQDFPTNELAYPAQFMAGRAAMGRFQYSDASQYFVPLINDTNAPAALGVQARFGYCEALRQMAASDTNNAKLQTATDILAQITPMAATNEAGALAWSELGDCNLQLGALDAATNAYTQALKSPAASQELRCRARVGLGIALEKKAEGLPDDAQKTLLDLALKNYQDVYYSDAETRDAFWTKEAGLHILSLVSKTGSLKGDQLDHFINDLKKTFPQLKDSAELKRLALKN